MSLHVLVQPQYSKAELNADSNYVVYTAWVRAMRARFPDWSFVVVFPDAKSGFKYEDDGFFRLPGVSRVAQRISVRRTANAASFEAAWYDALYRRYGFDVVWNNLPECAGGLRAAGYTTREDISKPAIVSAHNYVIHKSLPYEFHTHLALAELAGSIVSDHNVFNSDHCLSMMMDNARRFLSAEAIAAIEKTTVRIDYATLEDAPWKRHAHDGDPVIAYNHRLLLHKNWRTTFEDVFAKLWAEGIRFRVRYMNNAAESVGAIRHHPFVEVALSRNRQEYLQQLAGCDLNVIHSVHETFCISAAESMAFGQPLIAPHGVTFPEITGATRGNGYPWLFKSTAESLEMTRKLLTDPGARAHWGAEARRHVLSHYIQPMWAEQYGDLIARAGAAYRVGTNDTALQTIRNGLRACQGQTLAEFFSWLSTKAGYVKGKHHFGTQTATLTKILRLIRHVGGSCRLEGSEQRVYP